VGSSSAHRSEDTVLVSSEVITIAETHVAVLPSLFRRSTRWASSSSGDLSTFFFDQNGIAKMKKKSVERLMSNGETRKEGGLFDVRKQGANLNQTIR